MTDQEKELLILSFIVGLLGSIAFVLKKEIDLACEQKDKAVEDARIRYQAKKAGDS